MTRHRFAHVIPRTPWRRAAAALAALSLVLIAVIGFAVTGTGERPSLASGAGQFIVQCNEAAKVGTFDPIVYPGQTHAGHQHEFFGATNINKDSNYLSLYRSPTACDAAGDTAAYWVPTLYVSGVRLPAQRLTAYYNSGTTDVASWPPGLKVIAGNKNATSPQDTDVVYWGCGNGSGTSKVDSPPQCGGDDELTLHVKFPNCWDGRRLDSPNHQSHMAYDDDDECPPTHPKRITRLTQRYEYDARPDPRKLTIASGSVNTMHADFWNTWKEPVLDNLVDYCIRGGRQCDADETIAHQGQARTK